MFGEMVLLALGRQEAGIDRKGALAGGLRLWPLALTAEQERLIGVAVHVIGMGMQQSLQAERGLLTVSLALQQRGQLQQGAVVAWELIENRAVVPLCSG